MNEIHALPQTPSSLSPLGIILVPPRTNCKLCGGKLLVRNDRGSHIMVYTESFGTVVGTHYHKFCQNFRKGAFLDSTMDTAHKEVSLWSIAMMNA